MVRRLFGVALLWLVCPWPGCAWAQDATPSERLRSLEDNRANQDNYNAEEQTRQALSAANAKADVSAKFDDLNKDQRDQWQIIRDLNDSMLLVKFVGALLGLAFPIALARIFVVLDRRWARLAEKQKETSAEHKKTTDRIGDVESSREEVGLLRQLVLELTKTKVESLAGRLHHPTPEHAGADNLLEKLGGDMTEEERGYLKTLMEEREDDTDVGSDERKDARALVRLMGLVDKLHAVKPPPIAPAGGTPPVNTIAQRDDL